MDPWCFCTVFILYIHTQTSYACNYDACKWYHYNNNNNIGTIVLMMNFFRNTIHSLSVIKYQTILLMTDRSFSVISLANRGWYLSTNICTIHNESLQQRSTKTATLSHCFFLEWHKRTLTVHQVFYNFWLLSDIYLSMGFFNNIREGNISVSR